MGWKIWDVPHEILLVSVLPKHLIPAKVGNCPLSSSATQTKGKTGTNGLQLARITPSERSLSKNLPLMDVGTGNGATGPSAQLTRIGEKWFREITQGMIYCDSGHGRGAAYPLAFCKNHQGSLCLQMTTSVNLFFEAI